MASIAGSCLQGQQVKSGCRLEAYWVMPDHVHFLLTPTSDGHSTLTYANRWKGWTSFEMRRAGWKGKVWQPRSYDHLVRRDESLQEIALFIVANPVRAGLCESWDEYPWCGIISRVAE
jgi:REP element-mobilizing transposase RayT